MKIDIICVGKLKEKYLKEGINEYLKRISKFSSVEIIEVEDEPAPENLSLADEIIVKKKEAERIEKKIKDGAKVILLDLKGKKLDSIGLTDKLKDFMVNGTSHIVFVIGGSLGIHENLINKADFRMCISDMTFPHQLVRLILCEQIFRAFKIMKGEAYHK